MSFILDSWTRRALTAFRLCNGHLSYGRCGESPCRERSRAVKIIAFQTKGPPCACAGRFSCFTCGGYTAGHLQRSVESDQSMFQLPDFEETQLAAAINSL